MKLTKSFTLLLAAALFYAPPKLLAADVLENAAVRAEFGPRGLVSITEKETGRGASLTVDEFAVFAGNDSVESQFLAANLVHSSSSNRVYEFTSGPWNMHVEYELQPGWKFVSKRLLLANSGKKEIRVQRLELLRGELGTSIVDQQKIRDGTLLRFADKSDSGPTHSLFVELQNPFLQEKRLGQSVSLAYPPDLLWQPTNGYYASDRLVLGVCSLSGIHFPAQLVPEWKWVTAAPSPDDAWVDRDEVDAIVDCVRQFLLWKPTHSQRINIGWCENDYQIDIAQVEGRAEYLRIIDQAAAIGCQNILFAPADSDVSSLAENRDAWGWENLLWLGMGQKLRKGEWDPAKDPLAPHVQELLTYAKNKGIGLMAYVYPSLPFMQDPEWTKWVPNGQPRGYNGADTGLRGFQDWLFGKLVDFHDHNPGVSGYAFDHWWIAYDDATSSHYAQWAGCRRILEALRRRLPDIIIDGRQQYHQFGVWTWLAGSYPHPLNSDEQPESIRAFADLHWSRVSADRERRTAFWYRTQRFVPPEIMPGYMTHQTSRNDEKGETVRTDYRIADWDLLGWKYSVISSLATAPFNHVVNFLPARDFREYKAFSATDQKWFRDWFDWTDQNIEILRNVHPILDAPQAGHVDGTAAFKDGHGFVFLFDPNYRALPAEFTLDNSIGLNATNRLWLRQLYPDAEKGRLFIPPSGTAWNPGDKVTLQIPGADALALEVIPVPDQLEKPIVLGATGRVIMDGETLNVIGILGEPGTERELRVIGSPHITKLTANGAITKFEQKDSVVTFKVRFVGAPFPARQQIGAFNPDFTGGPFQAEATIPARVFQQLKDRKRTWPVEYTEQERAAVWLNSDRLLLYVNVADPKEDVLRNVTLTIDGQPVPLKSAYTAIIRNNPGNTFTGLYADISSLAPDVKHTFNVALPRLAAGQFQGLFFDTVEAEFTGDVTGN